MFSFSYFLLLIFSKFITVLPIFILVNFLSFFCILFLSLLAEAHALIVPSWEKSKKYKFPFLDTIAKRKLCCLDIIHLQITLLCISGRFQDFLCLKSCNFTTMYPFYTQRASQLDNLQVSSLQNNLRKHFFFFSNILSPPSLYFLLLIGFWTKCYKIPLVLLCQLEISVAVATSAQASLDPLRLLRSLSLEGGTAPTLQPGSRTCCGYKLSPWMDGVCLEQLLHWVQVSRREERGGTPKLGDASNYVAPIGVNSSCSRRPEV